LSVVGGEKTVWVLYNTSCRSPWASVPAISLRRLVAWGRLVGSVALAVVVDSHNLAFAVDLGFGVEALV
jgi:hypothetical protein